jgi:hypothetical protein
MPTRLVLHHIEVQRKDVMSDGRSRGMIHETSREMRGLLLLTPPVALGFSQVLDSGRKEAACTHDTSRSAERRTG